MDVLVIDVGGTSVKLWHTGHEEHRTFASGKDLTPEKLVEATREMVHDWQWEAIALGLPCRVSSGRPVEDPQNLGLLGSKGHEALGNTKWQAAVHEAVPAIRAALMADYVVLGGGSVKELEGGRKLWEELPDPAEKIESWVIL